MRYVRVETRAKATIHSIPADYPHNPVHVSIYTADNWKAATANPRFHENYTIVSVTPCTATGKVRS